MARPHERRKIFVCLLFAALAVGLSLFAAGETTQQNALRGLAKRGVEQLSRVANLEGDAGERLAGEALRVQITQDGGPRWVRDELLKVLVDNPFLEPSDATQNALRVEIVSDMNTIVLQLHLYRRGWVVRGAEPFRVRVMPWVPTLVMALAAVAALVRRRPVLGLVMAGVLGQVLLLCLPSESPFVTRSWSDEVASGPLLAFMDGVGRGPQGAAMGAGILVFCLMLAVFDHHRSRGKVGSMTLRQTGWVAMLVAIGGLAWVDCSARTSWFASLGGWQGNLVLLLLLCAWMPAIHGSWERRHG